MLDKDLSPKLLEVNINPAMFLDTPTLAEMLPKLVADTCNLACEIHKPYETSFSADFMPLLDQTELKYTVIYRD